MERKTPLEQAAEQVCIESSQPPLIFELPPEQGRARLEEAQNTDVYKHPADISSVDIDMGRLGRVRLHLLRPEGIRGRAETIFYIHGAGWVFGSLHTHDKLIRELAARTGCTLLFPEYSRSPEARYPTALNQCFEILKALPRIAQRAGWNISLDKLTVAGDSVGGNMATVMTLLAKRNGGPRLHKQLLYYPVTNAAFDTPSYIEFASGYYLYREGMMWFWDQYAPVEGMRRQSTASPLRASTEQLQGLPPAMIITGQADVLRDEGEAYAAKLLQAGVDVTSLRVQATIHDFVMLNALDQTNACRTAMDASTEWIKRRNADGTTV